VNLLSVKVPPTEAQILLKVKFADVDRATSNQLGADFFSTGLGQTTGRVTTGQFQSGQVSQSGFSLNDALNVFLFRSSDKLAVAIKALQARRLLEILAEPNVLAYNGKSASFLSGGEFPYPTLQGGGGGLGAVTIQFREFGVRITFVPTVTPRGTIHLQVTPEVSSLDFANGLVAPRADGVGAGIRAELRHWRVARQSRHAVVVEDPRARRHPVFRKAVPHP
jgi:pilus assembly protein CpaC